VPPYCYVLEEVIWHVYVHLVYEAELKNFLRNFLIFPLYECRERM